MPKFQIPHFVIPISLLQPRSGFLFARESATSATVFAAAHFGRAASASASPALTAQMQDMNQMAGTERMSESMTKMSEMCMAMMQKEKAMMPSSSVFLRFSDCCFLVLLLLVVLEIQWIK
jgi:hypothetical protein